MSVRYHQLSREMFHAKAIGYRHLVRSGALAVRFEQVRRAAKLAERAEAAKPLFALADRIEEQYPSLSLADKARRLRGLALQGLNRFDAAELISR